MILKKENSVKISRKFIEAVKLAEIRQYKICQKARPSLHPTVLSRLMNGIEKVKDNDARVVAIGRVLGLKPNECFEPENHNGGQETAKEKAQLGDIKVT